MDSSDFFKITPGMTVENRYSKIRLKVVERSPRRGRVSWVLEYDRGARLVYTQIHLCQHFTPVVTRSHFTPAVGSLVRFSQCGTVATVTGHTARGFTYKDGPVISIPRMGVSGTGEGEVFTDVPDWDRLYITLAKWNATTPLTA